MWSSIALQVCIMLMSLLAFGYWYIRNLQFSFWAKLGVPFTKRHWFFGNIGDWILSKESIAHFVVNIYQTFRTERFGGIWYLFTPALVVIDPELIRNIMVKDYEIWSTRFSVDLDHNPLSASLVFLNGDVWKSMRSHLSPAFTPGKLKRMFEFSLECGKDLEKHLNTQIAVNDGIIEASGMCERFVVDVNGLSALGIKVNSLNEDSLFYQKFCKEFGKPTLIEKIVAVMQLSLVYICKLLKLRLNSEEMTEYFGNVLKENLEYREKNNTDKHDFLDLLRSLRDKNVDDKLLPAQAYDFFLGAFETTATVIRHALHELAVNEDVQDRLREEVRVAKAAGDGNITWETLNNMKYLDMVVQETLRKYPLPLLFRKCVKPYRIPETNVVLPSGTMCFIPVYAIHHDPKYYSDPEKFDPERFTNETKNQRPVCTFLPFGFGPRNCIGMRFGEHQVKVALITVVSNFKVSLCAKSQNPLEFDRNALVLYPKNGVWLHVSKNN